MCSSDLTHSEAVEHIDGATTKAFVTVWFALLFMTGIEVFLGIIAFAVGRGKFKAEDVEVSGLYWHFVDLVWMFIFPLVYLMSARI